MFMVLNLCLCNMHCSMSCITYFTSSIFYILNHLSPYNFLLGIISNILELFFFLISFVESDGVLVIIRQ